MLSSAEYLSGGRSIQGNSGQRVAPNITGSKVYGIGGWKEKQIVEYLRTGQTPDGRVIDVNYCPVSFYKNATDGELLALARYLKSLNDS